MLATRPSRYSGSMTINEILATPPDRFDSRDTWKALDGMISTLSDAKLEIVEWNRVLRHTESIGTPTGHPHFRLGILHLLSEPDESVGLRHLRQAYESDQKFAPERAHRMAAYRLLSLLKDFLADLGSKTGWQRQQLDAPNRNVLLKMVFTIYDLTAQQQVLDMPSHTYDPFFNLIGDDGLRVFAGENYVCAQSLLEWVETDAGRSFVLLNECPFARVIVGLYGGVLEALLTDKLAPTDNKTLGQLINDAYQKGYLRLGTNLCALCIIILYFRNHVHASRTAARKAFFVDFNVARGLKVATDVAISELMKQNAQAAGNPAIQP